MKNDEIEIRRLQVGTRIGVPDTERAVPQEIYLSVWMRPLQDFNGISDNIVNTIDYHEVSIRLAELAASRPRHLIETIATDIADMLLRHYPLSSVDVKVEKKILPDADFVAVKITRSR